MKIIQNHVKIVKFDKNVMKINQKPKNITRSKFH